MRLVGRRLLMTLPTLFGVLVVAFLLLNVAPGDPVAAMVGERADAATIARLRADLHLDDPLPAQFGRYLWRSEEHTSELQSRRDLVCRLLLEKKKKSTLNESRTR